MRILLDHCVPRRLRHHLPEGHEIHTAYEMGWHELADRPLLDAAEPAFDVLLTTDQSLRFQQNLAGRAIGVLILAAPTNRLEDLLPLVPLLTPALERIQPGQSIVVEQAAP